MYQFHVTDERLNESCHIYFRRALYSYIYWKPKISFD